VHARARAHTHTHTHAYIYIYILIRRTACARAQSSGCSSTTNAYSETGQMAVCCQNLPLGALSRRSAPSLLVGALFKKFSLFLNTGVYTYLLAYCDGRGSSVCWDDISYNFLS